MSSVLEWSEKGAEVSGRWARREKGAGSFPVFLVNLRWWEAIRGLCVGEKHVSIYNVIKSLWLLGAEWLRESGGA